MCVCECVAVRKEEGKMDEALGRPAVCVRVCECVCV